MLLKNSRIIFLFVWIECLTISQQSNCQLPSTFSRDRYKVHLFLLLLTFCFPNFQCMRQQLAVIFKFESWISLLLLWKLGFRSILLSIKAKIFEIKQFCTFAYFTFYFHCTIYKFAYYIFISGIWLTIFMNSMLFSRNFFSCDCDSIF